MSIVGLRSAQGVFLGAVSVMGIMISVLLLIRTGEPFFVLLLVFTSLNSARAFWPTVRIDRGDVVVRNFRSKRYPLLKCRGVRKKSQSFNGTAFELELVGEPPVPLWAMFSPRVFMNMSDTDAEKRSERVSSQLRSS